MMRRVAVEEIPEVHDYTHVVILRTGALRELAILPTVADTNGPDSDMPSPESLRKDLCSDPVPNLASPNEGVKPLSKGDDMPDEHTDPQGIPEGRDGGFTSEAQRSANRRNASRSTGPRSSEGKARAAKNALRHGMHAMRLTAVPRGAFRENEEDLEGFVEAFVADTRPRDMREESAAQLLAALYWRYGRVQRVEAYRLAADGKAAPEGYDTGNAMMLEASAEGLLRVAAFLTGDLTAEEINFEIAINTYLKPLLGPNVSVQLPDRHAPAEEWKQTFDKILNQVFEDRTKALEYLLDLARKFQRKGYELDGHEFEVGALHALNETFERTTRISARLSLEIERQQRILEQLKMRDFAEPDGEEGE